jgi:predicted membrane GTPase involved in stress response
VTVVQAIPEVVLTFLSSLLLAGYMADDEVIEVTPKSIRLRKFELNSSARERATRQKAKQIRSIKGK